MKNKILLSLLAVPALCSCSSIFNGVKEFGDARVTADYFLKDYSDFFYYGDKDYVCVARASNQVAKGEYLSALNGKRFNSYRFYSFGNYEQPYYLVVNKYNKLKKIDEDFFYASKDASEIPISYLFFPYGIQDPESVVVGLNRYIFYDESVQNIEKGDLVLNENGVSYYAVKNYPNWIMKPEEKITKLYYLVNMPTFNVDMAWFAKDITVK